MLKLLRVLWALPWTCFGFCLGLVGLATGGGVERRSGIVAFWGGRLRWLLDRAPLTAGAAAITFGHVVLARSHEAWLSSREHELVHVRQYERWGPFFIPAYLLCSLYLWLSGRQAYLDNPFEIEAYEETL